MTAQQSRMSARNVAATTKVQRWAGVSVMPDCSSSAGSRSNSSEAHGERLGDFCNASCFVFRFVLIDYLPKNDLEIGFCVNKTSAVGYTRDVLKILPTPPPASYCGTCTFCPSGAASTLYRRTRCA